MMYKYMTISTVTCITNFFILSIADIPAKVTIRGCLDVDNRTKAGCCTDLNMINKQRKIIVKFLDYKISALKMKTGNFTEGEICIYSSFKAGVTKESQEGPNKSSPTATGYGKNGYTLLRFQFILTLCTLFVYFTVLQSSYFQKPSKLETDNVNSINNIVFKCVIAFIYHLFPRS